MIGEIEERMINDLIVARRKFLRNFKTALCFNSFMIAFSLIFLYKGFRDHDMLGIVVQGSCLLVQVLSLRSNWRMLS